MPRPRKEHGDDTRLTIIEVTTRLFAERGYAGTSLDQVAKAADTSKSSIFWHFDNKEDLLCSVVDHALAEFETRAGDLVLAEPTPGRAFARLLSLFRELAVDHGSTIRLLLGLLLEATEQDVGVRRRFQRVYEGYRRSVAQIVALGQASGDFSPSVDADALSTLFLAAYDGVFVQRLLDPETVPESVYDHLADLLFAALTPGQPRPQLAP